LSSAPSTCSAAIACRQCVATSRRDCGTSSREHYHTLLPEHSIAERSFSSSAHGTHLYKEVTGEGLWVWDLYQAFKRSTSYKLRSYSLE